MVRQFDCVCGSGLRRLNKNLDQRSGLGLEGWILTGSVCCCVVKLHLLHNTLNKSHVTAAH